MPIDNALYKSRCWSITGCIEHASGSLEALPEALEACFQFAFGTKRELFYALGVHMNSHSYEWSLICLLIGVDSGVNTLRYHHDYR